MRILFLAPHLSTGGMPQFLLKRIQSLKEYTDNEYYIVEYQCHSLDFVVQRNAIKSLLGENFTTLFEDKTELFKVIEKWQPDIIHIDEPSERLDRQMITKLYDPNRKYRIVETCHDIAFNPDNEKLFYPDLYMFCTPYHEQVFANMESKFITIQYPIDKQETVFKINTDFDFTHKNVLNVGLWTQGKNQGEGIEIARKYPHMTFHFVGNQAGNFKEYWEPLMKDLPSNVIVWGERSDVSEFMKLSDVFMFNSTWECNPLVLREAISYGLPIIARNLPQYGDMFTKYLQTIDTNLNTIQTNYEIPADNTTPIFAFRHEEAYKKILELPILKQKVRITQHFVDNPFLEIKGNSDSNFKVQFLDEKGSIAYENTIKANSWVKLNRQYFTKWTAKVWQDGYLIYKNTLNLTNKRVFIVLDSKSLGDTIAWAGYALEFQNKHNCQVVLSTFWNKILDYPELELVEPGTTINCYALYRIGWKWDENKEPVRCNTIPLQQAATNILGLDYEPLKPTLKSFEQIGKVVATTYVVIATNSTMECKFWTRDGWQKVINYLYDLGYVVYNVSKEDNPFDNCIKISDTSIENTIEVIKGAKLFIGLSSGLSWLAWALNQKVVMISNFTEYDHEFHCYRVTKPDVCNGCWNDANIKLDPYWDWCPRNKNFECQRTIPASMVIDKIKEAGF
jgi:autotransporter strand-loop-strand O-heptosyltransferase